MLAPLDQRTVGQRQADALRSWHEHYDHVYQQCGLRAPEPRADDPIIVYRRRMDRQLARLCVPNNHEFANFGWNKVDNAYLNAVEPMFHAACAEQRFSPTNIPPGELRMKTHVLEDGTKVNDFFGQQSFVAQLTRPGRRVSSWRTDHGYLYPNGNPIAVQQTRP